MAKLNEPLNILQSGNGLPKLLCPQPLTHTHTILAAGAHNFRKFDFEWCSYDCFINFFSFLLQVGSSDLRFFSEGFRICLWPHECVVRAMQLCIVCIDVEKGNMPRLTRYKTNKISVCVCVFVCTSHQLHIYIMSSCRLVLLCLAFSYYWLSAYTMIDKRCVQSNKADYSSNNNKNVNFFTTNI